MLEIIESDLSEELAELSVAYRTSMPWRRAKAGEAEVTTAPKAEKTDLANAENRNQPAVLAGSSATVVKES